MMAQALLVLLFLIPRESLYKDGLSRGRQATRDEAFGEAIEAFDQAIAARPWEARAWSGRGYARLKAQLP
ncbi:MAG: Flp pilus assembly protein TadD [Myxococcota bacterium]|jgi:Flp pilus assembly protein TadD